ncbi:MAG: 3-phosphoshikimate 1-carboxyvinyltransferase [Actinobacteria bacterium]|nr:3-phosphoshikimate 1-carboxyvinyltransferase [Actinomycetota bacterium]
MRSASDSCDHTSRRGHVAATVVTGVLQAPALRLVPGGPIGGALRAPASKSVTNRALIVAALASGTSVLHAALDSDDSRAMRRCLTALGARFVVDGGPWQVHGTGGRIGSAPEPLHAQLSGTTARFVTAVLALSDGGGVVTGAPPLRRRPIGPLVDALRTLGAKAEDTDGGLPVRLGGGGIAGGVVEVDVAGSSQFASAVLLAAPYAQTDVTCRWRGTAATDYIALTVELMRRWGADVRSVPSGWVVRAGAGYRPRVETIEYDASAAAHLYALAAATGGTVTVTNPAPTRQPDAGAVAVFEALGCTVTDDDGAVAVRGPSQLRPIDVSLAAMPDQVTTFATLAALAPGTSVLREVGVARLHETDRLSALATELGRLGVEIAAARDSLTVHGGSAAGPARLQTYDDHRLAMAFAAVGLAIDGVTIADPGCVAKTYPRFWDDLRALGGRVAVADEGEVRR